MTDTPGELRFEIEVAGTPEEVWQAIANGPGISSWYVPHVFEEREGAPAMASFGEGPEMQIPGRVAAWEPLYGPEAPALAARDLPRWQGWIATVIDG